jgi:hypothetical protein
MTATIETDIPLDLHTDWLSVYLDQWVWIPLARAANGRPAEALNTEVLAAVREASASGVVFSLT